MPAMWLGLVYATSLEEGKGGAMLRILLDYMQLLALVSDFDLDWPEAFEYFSLLHEYIGNAGTCILQKGCATSEGFYVPTLAAVISPLAIAGLTSFLWIFAWFIAKMCHLPRLPNYLIVSFFFGGFFYLYPYIVRTGLSAFLCETIKADEQWLRAALQVRCWDKKHSLYAFAASLPAVLLWGIGGPALSLLFLVRHRKHQRISKCLSYLLFGLRESRYFWVIGLALCKAAIATLHVFMASLSKTTQALTLVLLLCVVAVLQLKAAPYRSLLANIAERSSLIVVLSTAYAGLYFCTAAQSMALLVIVLLLHLCFALIWLTAICKRYKSPGIS
jgi:hypothetical protein